MSYKLGNIVSFLKSHGWKKHGESVLFNIFLPPNSAEYERDFFLEIPKNQADNGFNKYIDGIIDILIYYYEDRYTFEDFETFFSTKSSIFRLQIIDIDTETGSIRLERLKNAFNNVFQSIKQTVVFVVSNKQIFGNAKHEVTQYLNYCRGKQTDFGSYVVKLELPENYLTLLGERSIPNLLFETINFLTETTNKVNISDIDINFVRENSERINIELFESIIKLYKEAEIQNVNIALDSCLIGKVNNYVRIREQIPKIELFVRSIKNILLESVPLEAIGTIFRLSSKEVENSGKIWIETNIAEEQHIVEVQLKSERYLKSVEAHKDGLTVYIKGMAKQMKNKYVIEELIDFDIR